MQKICPVSSSSLVFLVLLQFFASRILADRFQGEGRYLLGKSIEPNLMKPKIPRKLRIPGALEGLWVEKRSMAGPAKQGSKVERQFERAPPSGHASPNAQELQAFMAMDYTPSHRKPPTNNGIPYFPAHYVPGN